MSEAERDFLDDDEPEVEEQETPETPEPAAAPVAETVETAAPEAPTAPEVNEGHSVPYAAMKAERDKRQEEQRRREAVERELAELRQQSTAPPSQPASFYEDPDQYLQAMQQQNNQRLYAALEAQAREVYPDYDEVFAELNEHANGNPAVVSQVLNSPNPALTAYKMGKQLRELKQMQDPETYRQKIEAEVRAKVVAEYAAKESGRAKAAESLPPDLTESRSAKGQFLSPAASVFDELF